jgi:hypothetical protein
MWIWNWILQIWTWTFIFRILHPPKTEWMLLGVQGVLEDMCGESWVRSQRNGLIVKDMHCDLNVSLRWVQNPDSRAKHVSSLTLSRPRQASGVTPYFLWSTGRKFLVYVEGTLYSWEENIRVGRVSHFYDARWIRLS